MSIPKPRREGQQGGRGGHSKNRELSGRRGGSPGASKPPKKGSGGASRAMTIVAVGLLAAPVSAGVGIVGYLLHGHGVI
jgi:hypothetical protein